jgi:hypothetical protein
MTSIIIVTRNNRILADEDPENIMFDFELIHTVTEYLSWRINQSYNTTEIAKGRDFGSKGEIDAADYIARKMGNLKLYDPDLDPECDLSYHQQIKDCEETVLIFPNITKKK